LDSTRNDDDDDDEDDDDDDDDDDEQQDKVFTTSSYIPSWQADSKTQAKDTNVTPRMKRYPIVEMELLAWWYRGHIRE